MLVLPARARAARSALCCLTVGAISIRIVGCFGPAAPDTLVLGETISAPPQLSPSNNVEPTNLTQITLDRDTLAFGSNLAQRWLEIHFEGDPSLIYVINDEPWVDARVTHGQDQGDAVRLTVDIDRSQLAIGEHSALLTIGADGANSATVALYAIQLGSIEPTGALALSHQTLNFGLEAQVLSTILENRGDRTLNYTVETSVPWAESSIGDGSIGLEKKTMMVSVSRQGLYPRTYFGWIEIRADNGQIGVISLIMTVPDEPEPEPPQPGPDPDPPAPSDPVDPPDPDPMQIIWFHSAAGWSDESLRLALASGRVTHVIVKGMHRADMSVNNPRVVSAIEIVRQTEAQLIWCRNLWPYENQTGVQQSDFFTAEYYRRELEQLAIEADLIGVDLTAVDPEPYGSSVMKPLIKGGDGLVPLSELQKQRLIEAVAEALDTHQPADYTLVAGVNQENNAYNFLNKLGRIGINQTTYYLNEARIRGLTFDYHIFGANLRTDPYRAGHPESPYFTIETLFGRSDFYAEKDGLFLFASRLHALSVAQDLFDYSGD